MAQKSDEKTNVMRVLEQKKISYVPHIDRVSGSTNGEQIAAIFGEDPDRCLKTLVTVGRSGEHYVFVIPVNRELDLKAAARAVGEKSVEMIHAKELLPLTGYVHGGCSPIGMKKFFRTTFDSSVSDGGTVYFSAGRIGYQVELVLADVAKAIRFSYADVTAKTGEEE